MPKKKQIRPMAVYPKNEQQRQRLCRIAEDDGRSFTAWALRVLVREADRIEKKQNQRAA